MNRSTGIVYEINGQYDHLYLDISSDRNETISRYSDLSPHIRKIGNQAVFQKEQVSNDSTKEPVTQQEIWYPVVDVDTDENMYGIFQLTGSGMYQLNQMAAGSTDGVKEEEFPASALEHWENNFLADHGVELLKFFVRKKYGKVSGKTKIKIDFLSNEWNGKIVLWSNDSGEKRVLFEKEIRISDCESGCKELDSGEKGDYLRALKASVDYILRNQVKKKDSRYYQGLTLFYDHDARTFRQPSWTWTWGPAISTLLDAADIPEIAEEYSKEYLYQAAREIGDASLRFQMTEDPQHPAYGLVFCRRDFDLRIKNSCMDFLSPPDSLFLAGWGWMALYRRTGEKKYLEATKLLVEQTARLLTLNEDIIEQDYMIPADEWKDWILDEAGFGMKGIAELYCSLPNEIYKEWGRVYITQILKCLEREDGLWDRMWTRSTQTASKASYHTRAMGWAMEGLLSSYQLLGEKQYLEKARKMADEMLKVQNEDGSWYFVFAKGAEDQGIAEKGTAYWSGLLYRLYEDCGDVRYYQAAKQALDWCLNNQYWGADSDGYGGIIGRNPSSGVIYRRFFDLSCTYTSAFVGDAVIRAWKYLQMS